MIKPWGRQRHPIAMIRATAAAVAAPPPMKQPAYSAEPSPDRALEARRVERAKAGDVAAFEVLYEQQVGRIYALCMRMSGDPSEAEELTQEAFVRAWQKLPSFRGDSAFGSWLHRLAVNVVLSRWRAAGRYRERIVAMTESVEEPRSRATAGLAIDLERAIAELPTGARTVFVLHDVEGWRHKDIARATGLAVGTSKTQLHRARKLLRKALNHG